MVRSAKPTPTMLPWLSSETSSTASRVTRAVEVGLGLDHEPADHVRVHAGAGVVLAQLADDQDVDLVERQPAHQPSGALEQLRLDLEDLLRLQRRRSRRCRPRAFSRIASPSANWVFSTRNSPTAGRTSQSPRKPSLWTWLAPSRLPRPMASILSTPDSCVAVEVGVRLDAVEQDDAVGLVGVAVEVDRQADGVGPQDDGLHVRLDRDAHGLAR